MKTSCTFCGHALAVDESPGAPRVVPCPACHANVRVREDEDEPCVDARIADPPEPSPARMIQAPPGFRVEEWGQSFVIRRRWFGLVGVIGVLLTAGFAKTTMDLWRQPVATGLSEFMELDLPADPMALGLAAVTLIVAYAALAYCFNQTSIEISGTLLTVRHGPLPWPGRRQVPVERIRQVYGRQRVEISSKGRTYYRYDLQAILKDGRMMTLVRSLTAPEHALYLEQEIERHLGIRDEHVGGELEKPVECGVATV